MNSKAKEPNERSDSRTSDQDSTAPEKKLRIFLSYGHDEYIEIAERVKKDLENRGHEVWFDIEKLKVGKAWEEYIEKGIDWVSEIRDRGRIVLLMTPHSVRRPDGFCLNELARAIDRQLGVIPIMVVQVEPPLCICRIQYLDLKECIPLKNRKERYKDKFEQLIDALENDSLDFEGVQSSVRAVLNPLSYDADIAHHMPRFIGREWFFDMVDCWLKDNKANRVFWITGDPGVGKTAIATRLCAKYPEVAAFHVCRFGDKDKRDPRRVVHSIAYQLSTQLPGLLDQINAIGNLEEVCEDDDASTIFERLIVDPLYCGVKPRKKPVVVLIDGLDEATRNDNNELAEFLANEMERPPEWVRFILTSRPEAEVMLHLQEYTPVYLSSNSKENREDIVSYLNKELKPFEPDPEKLADAISSITDQSDSLFLYVEEIRKEIEGKRLDLSRIDEFPQGLGGIYYRFFKRKFADKKRYEEIHRPVFSVIAAAFDPIPIETLSNIFGWNPYEAEKIFEEWGSFFPVRENRVRPFHRSLIDWLTNKKKAGSTFWVAPIIGHKKLAETGWSEYKKGSETMSEYFKANLPAHLQNQGDFDKLQQCVTDCEFIYNFSKTGRLFELSRYWKNIENDQLLKMCLDSWEKGLAAGNDFIPLTARCLGRLFQHQGDYNTALFYFGKELELAEKDGNENACAEAIYNIAWCSRHIDAFDEAIKNAETAKELFEKIGLKSGIGKCLSVKGICYWHKQEDTAALNELHQALCVFKEASDFRNQAQASNHLGIVYRSLGKYKDAIECLNESKKIYRKLGDSKGLGKCLNSIGTCLWWSGDLTRALSSYRKANQINTDINNQYVLGLTANNLGYIYLEKNDLQKAQLEFSKAMKIRQNLKIESYSMMDLSGLARVAFESGNIEEAKKLSNEAIQNLEKYDIVEDLRRAYYNHYIIMKDGSKKEQDSAVKALTMAKSLVSDRLKRITDKKIKNSLINRVPLIKEILEAEITTTE